MKRLILPLLLLSALLWANPLSAELLKLREFDGVGGDFTLTDHRGQPWTLSKQNKVVMLFFGYLNCPDICPMTLMEMVEVKSMLGKRGEQVVFVLVSLDHERDDPAKMKDYLINFDPAFIGLVGSDKEIAQVAEQYKVFYKKRELRSALGYSVDHSGSVYLISKEGNLRHIFPSRSPKSRYLQGLNMMLDGEGDDPLPKGNANWKDKLKSIFD